MTNDWLPDVLAEVRQQVASSGDDLLELSHQIHAKPEVRFQEEAAATRLTAYLTDQNFTVSRGIADLPTAFRAEKTFGTGTPTLAIFCEYDALPGIGHACGHNIIAAAGAGAGVAAANWLESNNVNGKLVILGSPGEEGGGGKVKLVEAGELADVAAAVMIHPAGFDAVSRTNLGRVSLEATFTGKASHAAAAPERGRNALDAATVLLVAIGLLRQQLQDGSRVHANVVDGGDSINVIPEHTKVSLFIRSTDATYLRGRLYEAVRDCVQGAALATGTTGELAEVAVAYEPVRTNPVMADLAEQAFAEAGRPMDEVTGRSGPAGSTDMGNVSQVVPAIHPYIQVAPDLAIHTREFAAAAATGQGDQAVLDGATVVGTVVAAMFRDPDLVTAATKAFKERK